MIMIHQLAVFLSVATFAGAQSTLEEVSAIRTYMTVEFDYKLEANHTKKVQTDEGYEEDNIFNSREPLMDALLDIDTAFIPWIQDRLPNGEIPEGKTLPDVKFSTVNSRFINMCFTESDVCKWVKSRIRLSFVDDRPRAAMERTTLALAREYLEEISNINDLARTTFVYPMIHSSTVQLEFYPVYDTMSDDDIVDLENSFYNVYHAIVQALDGDTDVSEAHFVYQIVEEGTLLVNMKYFGKCRFCTEEELIEIVNSQIESNEQALLSHIQNIGRSNYFNRVEEVSFSIPTPFDELPPIDKEILDAEAPSATKSFPWFLYLGAVAAVVVICSGIFIICKDQKELRKEEASTGEESESYDRDHHEGASRDIEEDNSASLNTNGMHEDYQVYVY